MPHYAVIDVETTHGDPRKGSIIEVGVLCHDGSRDTHAWSSLVRPSTPIPAFIRRLTGIGPADVSDAPRFSEVVSGLQEATREHIVVAHNVRYDMTALEHEFARTGLVFHRETLCTEQLSRELVPHLSHYNLGSLCRHFGIPFHGRHRALNDARATLALHQRLLGEFGEERLLARTRIWPWQARA